MSDLLGDRNALEQTRIIVGNIPKNSLGKKAYKQLVSKIYDNQLKKYTKLNRTQRHNRCKELFNNTNRGATGVVKSPALLSERALAKVLNQKQGDTIAEQGSQQ